MLKENIPQIYRNIKFIFQICSFVIVLITANPSSVFAQDLHADNIMPEYPGGIAALKQTVVQSLQYPEIALKAGISGIVLLNYTIDAEGKVQNIKVMQGLSPECDAEAIRVVGLLKEWEPGRRQGKPVNITISMPVEFKSDKKLNPLSVSGIVTEKTTGKVIEGAFVIVKGTSVGSVTSEKGSYYIELPAGSKDLIIFAVGYSSKEISIETHPTINAELEAEYYELDLYSSKN